MSGYFVTPQARADLFEIWEYVSRNSGFDRADYVAKELHDAMEKLAVMPGMGHRREDLADESLRVWTVFSFLIIYRPETSPVQVVRVIHGARDLRAVLREE